MKLTGIVGQLKKDRDPAQTELVRLDAVLAALGSLNGSFRGVRPKRRTMSAAACDTRYSPLAGPFGSDSGLRL